MESEIINFLQRFHLSDNVDEVFTQGCCYWFAYILAERFDIGTTKIMYCPIDNHFGTMIDNRIYDITGDVTDKYVGWVPWDEYGDVKEIQRIIRDCIMF